MLVDFGRANMLQKARQQPEKVKMVLEKAKTDGLATTVEAVRSKLNQPLPLGYCNVGRVEKVGEGVIGFQEGDRVVSNGPHADVVRVPKNLCARIPESVSDEEAAFTVIGAIGLQGIRLAEPSLGECFVVTGVGLIGLITVQLLRASGCRVLAIDYDSGKLELARQFGAAICNPGLGEDPVAAGMELSGGEGVDAVLITASTKSNDPVTQAARMSRQRGRIILIGVVGLELNRADFYKKELTFQVSCSYGPGRYDPAYEEKGIDYPIGFVRWTEQRNFDAILGMLASGQLDVTPLISHRFEFENSAEAYEVLSNDKTALGLMLEYDHPIEQRQVDTVRLSTSVDVRIGGPVVGFIGAGNYASRVLIPAFRGAGAKLHTVASSGGVSGVVAGDRLGFEYATTSVTDLIENREINTVVVATRHNTHARLTVDALRMGKNVFVEKPLAMTREEITEIQAAHEQAKTHLMVGFNRRFAPLTQVIAKLLSSMKEPKSFVMVMNAGNIPSDHWTQDPGIGGGRIIGEACHYIDLMRHLAGSPIVSVSARRMGNTGQGLVTEDKAAILLGFEDGSFGTIHYLANGAASFPKERIEVFCGGKILQLDNFRKLVGFGWPEFKKKKLLKQDKGQAACSRAFLEAVEKGLPTPIPAGEIFEVSIATLDAVQQLRSQD